MAAPAFKGAGMELPPILRELLEMLAEESSFLLVADGCCIFCFLTTRSGSADESDIGRLCGF